MRRLLVPMLALLALFAAAIPAAADPGLAHGVPGPNRALSCPYPGGDGYTILHLTDDGRGRWTTAVHAESERRFRARLLEVDWTFRAYAWSAPDPPVTVTHVRATRAGPHRSTNTFTCTHVGYIGRAASVSGHATLFFPGGLPDGLGFVPIHY
jgi:hypothetical protein